MTAEKNIKIRNSILMTRLRRKSQACRVFKVKIDYSKLNAKQKEQLKMIFVEAKWLYNMLLSQESLFETNPLKIKEAVHYTKDKKEIKSPLSHISSQMKQSVMETMLSNVRMLSTKKKRGQPVGKLKYLSDYKAINLKQYGTTYNIVGKNKIKIQRISGTLKVNGLKQLKLNEIQGLEITNAKLLSTASGYYLAITTFSPKEKEVEDKPLIGIDLGCKTTVTCSDGAAFDCIVEETERLKRLQRKLQAKKKGSNSYRKVKLMLRKEYEHVCNIRTDKANKIISQLKNYKIVMQDEDISSWKDDASGTGRAKTVQHSCLGRIKRKLVSFPDTVVISRWLPTTKICSRCGTIVEGMTLKDRAFVCPKCGNSEDRDLHAAKNMLSIYKILVGAGHTDFKRQSKVMRQEIASYFAEAEGTTL